MSTGSTCPVNFPVVCIFMPDNIAIAFTVRYYAARADVGCCFKLVHLDLDLFKNILFSQIYFGLIMIR